MQLKYIHTLDGLRAIAILLVIIWHYFTCQIETIFNAKVGYYVKFFTSWTWSGVDLFFVLSGFLIGRILINAKGSTNYFKTFYLRRVFRIFPAYYLVLFILILLLITRYASSFPWLIENKFPNFSFFFYLQNFWISVNGFGPHWLGVTWSLAVEEQFYLVLPLIIFFTNKKFLPKLLCGLFVLAPFFRYYFTGLGSYVLLPARMDSLLIGVLIAYYYLTGDIKKYFENRISLLFSILLFFIVIIYVFLFFSHEEVGGIFIHTILALFYGVFVIFALVLKQNSFIYKCLSNSFMLHMSKISYMVYLTHLIFSGILHQIILHQTPQLNNINDIFVTILALICTIIFSSISYKFFEQPFITLGKRFNY